MTPPAGAGTPPRQLAREVITNLIVSSHAPPEITAKAIMGALERQHLAIFPREPDSDAFGENQRHIGG
jgi:hypothetical protein